MQTYRYSSRQPAAVLLTVGMLALVACGRGGDAPVVEAPPTQTPAEPTATLAEPTSPTPMRPEEVVVPATVPEPGSDEAQILAVLEKQILAVHAADYVAFQETCTPSGGEPPAITQLRYIYEEREGVISVGNQATIRFSPQGYNVRNAEVKLLRAPFARSVSMYMTMKTS